MDITTRNTKLVPLNLLGKGKLSGIPEFRDFVPAKAQTLGQPLAGTRIEQGGEKWGGPR